MASLYEIKIELLDVEPLVWRRILVPDDMSLTDLNAVIQGAMGWQAAHLSAFEIDGKRYDLKFVDDDLDEESGLSMQGVLTRDVLRPGVEASFQYDFGDDWWHRLDIGDRRPIAAGDKPPRCLEGARACPPEDCGGPFGYADMLYAASHPDDPAHEEVKEWLGRFDPEKFDVRKANRDIKKILAVYRDMK